MENKKRDLRSGKRTPRFLRGVVVALLALIFAVPIYSWLFIARHAAAITPISDPTALFINAGNKEDARYIEMSGIDVSEGTYRDYVFCVSGNNVSSYMLQLAYTTNNQFTFEIYRAEKATGSVPAGAIGVVEYTTHDATPVEQSYYIPSASSEITGHLLNNRTGSGTLAKDDDGYYDATYEGYSNFDQYAVPLYWHADSTIRVLDEDIIDEFNNFCHYFIIRVRWTSGKINDKETDILYISAKNSSS